MSKNEQSVERLDAGRSRLPGGLLLIQLLTLHGLTFGGWQSPAVRLLWLVALGAFLAWQPFVAQERRVGGGRGIGVVLLALISAWWLNPWILLVWCGLLAAVIGGQVMRSEFRGGYLLAFGYLVALTVLGVVPELTPLASVLPLPREVLAWYLPLALAGLLFLPTGRTVHGQLGSYDLFYGAAVFLVLAVLVLGSLATLVISRVSYVEALLRTLLAVAGALALLAWVWNPGGTLGGLGAVLSRHLLSVGMPIDRWLAVLADEAEREEDAAAFLGGAMTQLAALPGIRGVAWRAGGGQGHQGEVTPYFQPFAIGNLGLTLYFERAPGPSLRWHASWLLRLAAEFYLVKHQAAALRRMQYVEAVHEAGARVTHDVKNLLQSLQTLCFAAVATADDAEVSRLIRRQLPLLAERLKLTLDKLRAPVGEDDDLIGAATWWTSFRERHAHTGVVWEGEPDAGVSVPGEMFETVAANLLQNAFDKRGSVHGLRVIVAWREAGLQVEDNGPPVPLALAGRLFAEPLRTENGFGVGLYQAARLAESRGYTLALASNVPGMVRFTLSKGG